MVLTAFALLLFAPEEAGAIPAFSRKYNTSCSTCHYAYPKLNAFGKAFNNNGFRFPEGQDAEMAKEEPVKMGAEGYKYVWPDAIWPADIPGSSPLSVHAFGRIHYGGSWDDATTTDVVEEDKGLSFEIPHEFELIYGGTIGEDMSFFGELEYEHESEFAYEFFLQYDFSPGLHLKLGSVGLNASPEHHRLTREHYNVVDLYNQSKTWRMRSGAGGGVEVWGAGNSSGGTGGYTYAVGMGNGQNDEDNFDQNTAKDFYGRATYKMGGLGEIGGTEGQSSESSAFYEDNSVRLGGFFYKGTAIDGILEDKFTVTGADVDWWYNRINVVALFMTMSSDYDGIDRSSQAYFAEGNYVVYPWLIARARYESTDKDTDLDVEAAKNLIPGVVFMVRANVKASIEYLMPLDDARDGSDRMTIQFNFAF